MEQKLKNNILALYVIKISKWFSIIMPIVVLFYQENDLSMFQIFTLKSIYSISMLALEIPSGYLGDRWGRKKTLLTGSILVTIGFGIYSLSSVFISFLVAEIILGFGQSFISGSDSAILYDSLKHYKKENRYIMHEGRITSAGNFAEAIAGLLAGFIAAYSFRLPFVLQTAIAALAIPASLILFDPFIPDKTKHSLNHFWKVVKNVFINPSLRYAIILSSITGCATLTFAWFVQPYLIGLGIDVIYFGIIWTILNVIVGVSSFFAHRFEAKLQKETSLLIIIVLIPFLFTFSGFWYSKYSLILLALFYIVRGYATPVLKNHIHFEINNSNRATILSIRNMIIRLLFAIIAPFAGKITDIKGVDFGLRATGGIFFLGFLFLGLSLRRMLLLKNKK